MARIELDLGLLLTRTDRDLRLVLVEGCRISSVSETDRVVRFVAPGFDIVTYKELR